MAGGGVFATALMMAVTYASGALLDLTGRLGEAWSHVTPGQAALIVGLLTYATHHGKEPARRICAWVAARTAASLRKSPFAWLTCATVLTVVALALLARAAFAG